MTKITIWTWEYRPFIMGGDVTVAIKCDVECSKPISIGRRQKAVIVTAPSGKTFVADNASGGIVGDNLDMVKADVAAAKPKVLHEQIEWAKRQRDKAERRTPEKFWRSLKGAI